MDTPAAGDTSSPLSSVAPASTVPSTTGTTAHGGSKHTRQVRFDSSVMDGSTPKRAMLHRLHRRGDDATLDLITPGRTADSPQRSPRQQPAPDDDDASDLGSLMDDLSVQDIGSPQSEAPTHPAPEPRRAAPPVIPIDEIPARHLELISFGIKNVTTIASPRPFQIEAANHCIFNDHTILYIIRRTADGKSLVPMTIAFFRRGVSVVLVPLIGLGCDQVEKATNIDHNIEAYHADEHKNQDAKDLCERLLEMTDEEAREVTIMLYLSPTKLLSDSGWYKLLFKLAERGLISQFCIDEAHYVHQSGRDFRPDFIGAVKSIPKLMAVMPRPVPIIAMSATFRKCDRDVLTDLLGANIEPNVIHGSLARRDTMITCHIAGNPAGSLKTSAAVHFRNNPDKQQLWYTNSRLNAETSMLDAASKLIEANQSDEHAPSVASSFTGADGIMLKTGRIDGVTGFSADILPDGDDDSVASVDFADFIPDLPNIQIVVGTSAVEAGISSNALNHGFQNGFPATLYALLQNSGRVNRRLTAEPGTCTYEVHVSFDSLVSLYLRIMRLEDKNERAIQLADMVAVVRFLVTPDDCYHTMLENYFEFHQDESKEQCGQYCTHCLGLVRGGIKSLLSKAVFDKDSKPNVRAFMKILKNNKGGLFHDDDVPKHFMGPLHALALQLFAKTIIGFRISDTTKIGTKDLKLDHVLINLPMVSVDGELTPAYVVNDSYSGLNYI